MFKTLVLLISVSSLIQVALGQCSTPYTVTWGDTCNSIAQKAGISFPTFIALNKPITCSALQPGQQLCLAKVGFTPYPNIPCTNKYTVQPGDTCDTMALNSKTALTTILAYNPGLDCTALQNGQLICLDNTAPLVCTSPYTVQAGDTCLSIASKAGISFTTFIALNKPITCSALQPGQQLCLAKQGFTPYPIVQCANKYTVVAGDTCDTISLNSKVALGSIFSYNPGLDCTALQPGQQICLDNSANVIIPNCSSQYTVQIGDTCNSIAAKVGISYTSLIALNKPINCAALQYGQQLCLAKPGFAYYPIVQCVNTYTVVAGDTCSVISMLKTRVSLTQLYAINPGLDCTALQPGQNICF